MLIAGRRTIAARLCARFLARLQSINGAEVEAFSPTGGFASRLVTAGKAAQATIRG
jgi:hypothetical protein